jgi:hypothetical protein
VGVPDRVIIQLNGGIGNILFQFAAGESLKLATGLTPTFTEAKPGHLDRLEAYVGNVFEREKTKSLSQFPNSASGRLLRSGLRKAQTLIGTQIEIPPHEEFEWKKFLPRIPIIPIQVRGYFQSPSSISEGIQSVLHFLERTIPVESEEKAVLHLRRGDYVTLGWALPTDYYKRALAMTSLQLGSQIRVVGEDPLAVLGMEQVVRTAGFTATSSLGPTNSALNDFARLSSSPIQILSNSSFSWWGAALAAHRLGKENVEQIGPNTWTPTAKSEVMIQSHWKCC